MLIDTHCHLDFNQFDEDREEVLERAAAAGISFIINPGADLDSSRRALDLAREKKNIYAAAGIHPHYASQVTEPDIAAIDALAGEEKLIAIGEVGLDYFDRQDTRGTVCETIKDKQKKVLSLFMELAEKRSLPVIFHCRRAAYDLLPMISSELRNREQAVVHCFSEDRKTLRDCLDLGMYVSFTANVTFPKAQELRELVAYAPLDRLLLETDAPYLAAQEHRGKRNEPAFLSSLAREVSRIKKQPYEKIAQQTSDNAVRFFRLQV